LTTPEQVLPDAAPVRIIAAGKAAPAMAHAALGVLGARVRGGLLVSLTGETIAPLESIQGEHPVPGAGSERAGRRALAVAKAAGPDHLLVLLSGGASAMMAVPAGGVTLADKQAATRVLLRSGADIHALNTVRKHLSAIKGGQLAAAAPAPCTTLAVSDVVGDDLHVIASGPTVADATTYRQALDVLVRHQGLDSYPAAVVDRLKSGAEGRAAETPKPGDRLLAGGRALVVGGRGDAMRGAGDCAQARGYRVVRMEQPTIGAARVAARTWLAACVAQAAALDPPLCIVSSGETTVDVAGRGRGGRNQEFALALVAPLAQLGRTALVASVGTDGYDGPTDAAGALADVQSAGRAAARGLAPAAYLEDNNAYEFFAALGDLVRTGPTGTNVGDLQLFLLA
jgi:hydroxypyruvate reductase